MIYTSEAGFSVEQLLAWDKTFITVFNPNSPTEQLLTLVKIKRFDPPRRLCPIKQTSWQGINGDNCYLFLSRRLERCYIILWAESLPESAGFKKTSSENYHVRFFKMKQDDCFPKILKNPQSLTIQRKFKFILFLLQQTTTAKISIMWN